jgi:hypothetical protein
MKIATPVRMAAKTDTELKNRFLVMADSLLAGGVCPACGLGI